MVHSHSTSLNGLTAVSRSINSRDKAENEFSLVKRLALGSQRCLWTCGFPSARLKESFPNPCSPSVCALMHHATNHIGFRSLLSDLSQRDSETGEGLGEGLGSSISCPHWISTPSRVAALWVKVKQQLYNHRATSEHSKPCFNGAKYSRRNFSKAHTNLLLVWQPCDIQHTIVAEKIKTITESH